MRLARSLFALLIFSGVCFAQARNSSSGLEPHTVNVGGLERHYLLHLPPGWTAKIRAPAILMLHGGGGDPEHSGSRDLNQYADAKGFMVAYPEGINRSWNDGRLIKGRSYDDVAFLSALIDELVQKQNADSKRIYVTGMSNGGFMAFTLACRIPQKIAAIAPVAASMGTGAFADCHPQRSIPVMMINGTADPLVHWQGGQVLRRSGSESEPIPKVVEFWRRQACGSAKPMIRFERLPDLDPNDDSNVEVERVFCPGGDVVNYTVTGGGHTWPGGVAYLPRMIVGPVNRDFSASHAIVEFFSAH